jgi:hypothetical protein
MSVLRNLVRPWRLAERFRFWEEQKGKIRDSTECHSYLNLSGEVGCPIPASPPSRVALWRDESGLVGERRFPMVVPLARRRNPEFIFGINFLRRPYLLLFRGLGNDW